MRIIRQKRQCGNDLLHRLPTFGKKKCKKIYSLYLSGESLKTIAALLTYEKVEFLPDRWNWNKNRIVRILDDTRYMGTERYASIISADVYQQAQDIKLSRNTQTDYDRTKVISTIV